MIGIVADTNVIVSALVFGGLPRTVLELAEAGHCELFYSAAIQGEVRRVLAEKFQWSAAMLQRTLPHFWGIGKFVVPQVTIKVVLEDPDDDRILECAFHVSANFLVTGDRHLLALRRYHSTKIVSPREFVDTILAR